MCGRRYEVLDEIKKVSENYFIVNVNDVFENRILEQYLKLEFEKVKLNQKPKVYD